MSDPAGAGAPEPEWFRSFFTGLAVEMWRQAVPEARIAAEIDFAADLLDLEPPWEDEVTDGMAEAARRTDPPGGRILDVPCGTGRHALELATRGYPVTAVDLSAPALTELSGAAEAAGLALGPGRDLELRRLDMRALPFAGEMQGAVCLGNSFGYFPPADCRAFLAGLGRALRPGGRLLLHSAMAAECLLPGLEPRTELQVGDIAVAVENRYDALAGRLDTLYRLQRGAEAVERQASHWVFTLAEIARMLEVAGLRPQAVFGDPEGAPFALGETDEAYILAEKPF